MSKHITIIVVVLLVASSGLLLFTLNSKEMPVDIPVAKVETFEAKTEAAENVNESDVKNKEVINKENTSMTKENAVEIAGVTYELFVHPLIDTYVKDFGGPEWFIEKYRTEIEAAVAKSTDTVVLVQQLGASNLDVALDLNSITHSYTLVLKKNDAQAGLFVENPRGLRELDVLLTKYDENNVDEVGNLLIYEIDNRRYFVNQDAIKSYAEGVEDPEMVSLIVPSMLSNLLFYVEPSVYIGDGTIHGITENVTYKEKGNDVYITITKEFFDENVD